MAKVRVRMKKEKRIKEMQKKMIENKKNGVHNEKEK